MGIYEELHRKDNEFILAKGVTTHVPRLPRMPVLDANQPTRIVAFTAPDKRPSIESLNLAPPFAQFFIEASIPPDMQHTAHSISLAVVRGKVQECVLSQPVTDIAMRVSVVEHSGEWELHAEVTKPRWMLECQCYYNIVHPIDPLCLSDFQFMFVLGDDGFPVSVHPDVPEGLFTSSGIGTWVGADGNPYSVYCRHSFVDALRIRQLDAHLLTELRFRLQDELRKFLPLLYAINSLHSKRTEIVTVPPTRQQRRHAARTGGQQPPDRRTIVVKDFVRIFRNAQRAKTEGNKYPLHEVIGHWRSYGANGRKGLLFGKYAGTFFVPSFSKGNPDVGATDHDYRLTA